METTYNIGYEVMLPPNDSHITGETKLIQQRQAGLSASPYNNNVVVLSKYQGIHGPHQNNERTVPFLNQTQLFEVASKMAYTGVIDILSLSDVWPAESSDLDAFLGELRIPVIWEVCTMDFFQQHADTANRVSDRISKFIVVADAIRDQGIQAGIDPAKFEVVHPTVDTDIFKPASLVVRDEIRGHLGLNTKTNMGIYTGRFSSAKGTDFMIQNWRSVSQEGGQLVLIGSAGVAEQEAYLQMIGKAPGVRYEGFITDDRKKAAYLRAADYFVMPSHSEGISMSVLEAMACGLPIVASAEAVYDSALGEIVFEDITGHTFRQYKPADLLQAVRLTLQRQKRNQYSANAARFILENGFDLKSTLKRVNGIYQSVLRDYYDGVQP